ncbi:MAG: PD-(D/E)XK motif protein [Methylomarinum sp.]|nr:PD-(D/E)XK motif protein [Methylomarinum sp.]
MESIELEAGWDTLKHTGESEYIFKRIDSVCIPELNIGINSSLERCLSLELPKKCSADFQTITRQNLTLLHFLEPNCIVLQLTDDTYNDLFNDLVVSLYQRVKNIPDASECSMLFIQTFHKWSEFFHDETLDRLNKDTIKGLFGELFVLKSFVQKSTSANVNGVLNSWTGPYDQGHDFVLDNKEIEVKTKGLTKISVRISSEQQLDNSIGKSLELLVLSVEEDLIDGVSVGDLVHEIRLLIINFLGDTSILLRAINQKGLTLKNIKDYDNFRFRPVNKSIYDCLKSGFPKLIKDNLLEPISNVKYDINLSVLDDYLLESEQL